MKEMHLLRQLYFCMAWLWIISVSAVHAGPLDGQSSSLYFSLPVHHYKVQMEPSIAGHPQATIILTVGKGTVMSDRPYRQERDTDIGQFLNYLHKKPLLNLSLEVSAPHTTKTSILNFEVKNVIYQQGQDTVIFKAHLLESPGYQVLASLNSENDEIIGRGSMLFVDG